MSVLENVHAVLRMHQIGIVNLLRPDRLAGAAVRNARLGPQAALIMKAAAEHPHAPALTDERGTLNYRQLDEQSNALARALTELRLPPRSVIGVVARDHRGLVLTISAAARAGLRLALMNTGLAPQQFAEVVARENVRAVLYDSEFAALADAVPDTVPRYLTWADEGAADRTIDMLIAGQPTTPLPLPDRPAGFIILTSGTTGLPKGAPRTRVSPLASALIADRIPFPRQGAIVVASPLFHSTGFGAWTVGLALADHAVLLRRFDAERILRAIADHRASMLVAVPTMLTRILALGPETIARYDTTSLRTVFVAGSPLAPELTNRFQDTFGEVVYNVYGSTEVAVASVAQPAESRRAPGTVGRPPVTVRVALYDDEGTRVTRPHVTARVFVRTGIPFEGYTDGRHKQVIDGHMATGDRGHLDENGLLYIDGRDDDMIISGGENVYPVEVENLLTERDDVIEAAVIGVDDPEFGTRLRAYIVPAEHSARDPQEIRDYVKALLARYKVPRDVVFIDELPRNATGKVLRRLLQ
ncbi:acyl-CoA synthetase [Actinoplanes sp. SE50]|uniref:AMP-binding protein n=1 Tax=unclassified Actinoplanes TaxID=2626549 RepID=UPI00023ECF26|nr:MULTISPECIES: AMP-binding protein [unclassified Actinoplanes]AEV86624.1 fatty-acyl-CoA synthase [Actinoplanes sp. SE50/110]ATO85022.1 acyl-CoA synthetase [Actinoplanes sp. SE50]SLM02432.1 acyl-CoA synthetase [Actinoplanes sp. SE50/110]